MKNFKNQKGITLVALVVTIIVLLILAGVSLSLIAGENGILGRATKAVDKTLVASAQEEAGLLLSNLVAEFYEATYVNGTTLDTDENTVAKYVKKYANAKTTDSGYYVSISENTITVKKSENGSAIVTGNITDKGGVENWTPATTGGTGEGSGS